MRDPYRTNQESIEKQTVLQALAEHDKIKIDAADKAQKEGNSGKYRLVQFLLSVPLGIFSAFVLTKLWLWFAVPLGLPMLGIVHAWGLRLTLVSLSGTWGMTAACIDLDSNTAQRQLLNSLAADGIVPLFALSLGYIVSLFL